MHRDHQSRTLLHHAVSTGSKEVVRYLLDHGKPCPWGWVRRKGCQALSAFSLSAAPPEILDAVEEK